MAMMHGKVLIVEANRALAELWCNYLKRHGFDAIAFIDNRTEVGTVTAWGIAEVIVSAVAVDDRPLSGQELCRQIYGDSLPEADARMWPVIHLSGSYLTEERRQRFAAGSFMLLHKPVTPGALLEAVRKAWFRALATDLQRQAPAAMTAELAGQALAGIFQFVAANRRHGYVLVEGASGQAVIAFAEGAVVAARSRDLTGAEVIHEVLCWPEGQAAFHAVESVAEERQEMPELATMIAEGMRQAEAMARARAKIARPGVMLRRNESINIADHPHTTAIRLALDREISWEALRAALTPLSERQILAPLHDMLGRDEIIVTGKEEVAEPLSPEDRRILLARLADQKVNPPLLPCPRIGVFSVSGKLARHFLGVLSGQYDSGAAVLENDGRRLVLTAGCGDGHGVCAGLAGGLVILDAGDVAATSAPTLLARLGEADLTPLVIILTPDAEGNAPPSTAAAAKRLGTAPEAPLLTMSAWDVAAARQALSAALACQRQATKPGRGGGQLTMVTPPAAPES